MTRSRAAFVAALVSLALVGCTSSKSAGPSAASSSAPTTTRPQYTPVFTKGPCSDEVPTDPRVECGTLTVPEDRSKPEGRKVVLPVATVHTADPNPAPDPVLYLSGGPGEAALPTAQEFLSKGQTGNRDVILLEQRGTGRAEPHLDCPEVTQAYTTILGAAASFDAEAKIGNDALAACRDRLRAAGVDLNQYNTANVADDIADLRVAMGIKEWNLFGVSYGTMDALVTMRAHPEGIRSVVLDSVVPPDVGNGASEIVAKYARVSKVLFDGCAKDARCSAKYPNLASDFQSVVQKLDATPYQSTIDNPELHTKSPITITGADASAGLFLALYDTGLIPQLPGIIQVLKGDSAGVVIDQLAARGISFSASFAAADAAAVNCFDGGKFIHDGDAERVGAEQPDMTTLLLFSTVSCKDLGVAPAPPGFNDPVHSDIPTLVLSGEYDPVTPPAQSKHATETLSHSTFVEFPGMGHAEVFAVPECPEIIFRAFLAGPTAPVDTSCAAAMGPPNWSVG
jgi:pimeloyl-ACP methyl ester carboxylesterase